MRGWQADRSTAWEQLSNELMQCGMAAVVVVGESGRDPDLARFAGEAHLGPCLVVATPQGPPLLGYSTPMEREEAEETGCLLLPPQAPSGVEEKRKESTALGEWILRALGAKGVRKGLLGVAGRPKAGELLQACSMLAAAGWSLTSAQTLLLRWRERKLPAEVAEAERVAEATCRAMRRVARTLALAEQRRGELYLDGRNLTVGFLRQVVARELASAGLEQSEGNIVSAGSEAAVPHTRGSSERRLKSGETIIVDLFPRDRLYADCTRTFVVGKTEAEIATSQQHLVDTLKLAYAAARPGVPAAELHRQASAYLQASGYDTLENCPQGLSGFVHLLGHGVGYELHELPSFREQEAGEGLLQEGQLLTLEPGLYSPQSAFGVRIEDYCVVEASGLRSLTPLPYDLDPASWS